MIRTRDREVIFWCIMLCGLMLFIGVRNAFGEPFYSGQNTSGPISAASSGGAGGGIAGPVSSTDNALPRWNGVGGDTLQSSSILVDDSDNVSGVANFTATGTTTLATGLSGVLKASSGVVSSSDVDLTSEVTGALPIANGGSGQSSKTAAFDALSPSTTKGDLIISDGTNGVRYAVCANGETIIAASGEATGWDCGTPQSDLSDVTGTLGLSNGGTGQTSKTAAFDALSPTTTKGDLIISNGTDNVRFPVCSNGEIIEADSAEATGWVCSTPAGGAAWGDITGTLSDQTDLQTALNAKAAGAASSLDNELPSFDGTGGKTLQAGTGITNPASAQLRLESAAAKIYMDAGTTNFGIKRNGFGLDFWIFNGGEGYDFRIEQNDLLHSGSGMTLGSVGFTPTYTIKTGSDFGPNNTTALILSTGDFTGTSQAKTSGNISISAGDNASSDNAATAGDITITSGSQTSASSAIKSSTVTIEAGDNAGSGDGGDVQINGGSSGSGDDGIVILGAASTTPTHRLNISTQAAGANTATMTNSPVSGNPAIWVRININGTDYVMPAWTAP